MVRLAFMTERSTTYDLAPTTLDRGNELGHGNVSLSRVKFGDFGRHLSSDYCQAVPYSEGQLSPSATCDAGLTS